MKTMSFTVAVRKPRDPVARAMLERDGQFRPREFRSPTAFKRRPKNRRQAEHDLW